MQFKRSGCGPSADRYRAGMPMAERELTSTGRMIRNRPRAAFLFIGALLFIGCAAMAGMAATADGEPLAGSAVAVVFVGAAVWCCLTARSGVLVSDRGVVVRRYLRDRFVPWDEVVSFGLRPYRSRLGEELQSPSMILRSGEAVRLMGVEPPGRPFGISSKPFEFKELDELDRLAQRRPAQRWRRGRPS